MDKAAFTEIDWWLTSETVASSLEDARRAVAEQEGWDPSSWFSDRDKLAELFTTLESRQSSLLTDVDEANDEDKQRTWLDNVLAALRTEEAEPQENDAQEEPRDQEPQEQEAQPEEEQQEATQQEEGQQGEAGQEEGEQPQPTPSAASAEDGQSQPSYAWSDAYGTEGSGMFYRLNSDTNEYEFAFSTTGDKDGAPVEPWAPSAQEAVARTANIQTIEDLPVDVDPETAARFANDPEFAQLLQTADEEAEQPELWDWDAMEAGMGEEEGASAES